MNGDNPMGDQLLQPVRQNIRRDSLVGTQKLFVRTETAEHHVADNQQRPAVTEDLHRSIERTTRSSFGTGGVLPRHIPTLAFLTCILQVTCCRLAFPSQRSSVAS